MDPAAIKQQALKFNQARGNLLAVIIFTALNLVLTACNANLYLLFSATMPQFVFAIGQGLAQQFESNIFLFIGLVIAVLVLTIYLICWFCSKRKRAFMLGALIFFAIDTVLFLFLALSDGFEASYLLDIFFHGWVLFYLINGVIAWSKLRGVQPEMLYAALQDGMPMVAPSNVPMNAQNDTPVAVSDDEPMIADVQSEAETVAPPVNENESN